jgi:Tfp pilus assembly protein PilN
VFDINLLGVKKTHFKLQLLVVLTTIFLILFIWHMGLQKKNNDLEGRIIYLEKKSAKLSSEFASSDGSQEQITINSVLNQMEGFKKRGDEFMQILQVILQGVFKGTYLTQLLINNGEIKIVGQIRSISRLAVFIKRLDGVRWSDRPAIQKLDRKEGWYDFTLSWLYR